MASSNKGIDLRKSVSIRLLKKVFIIYFSLTFVITCIHAYSEFQYTKDQVLSELKSIEKTFSPSLATALWAINDEQIESISIGILNLPIIVDLKIQNAKGESLFIHKFSEPYHEDLISHRFDLFHFDDADNTHLAKVTFISDNSIVLDRVKFGLMILVLNALIKSILLWALFVWAFKKILFKPLNRLTDEVAHLDLDSVTNHQINLDLQHEDELKLLETTFNKMLSKLSSDKTELIKTQAEFHKNLELTVVERTKDLEEAIEQLQYFASTDTLTAIYNRRSFFEQSSKYYAMALRHNTPLLLLMMDIDYFKNINDEYGHAAGDAVLSNFAKKISSLLRKSDLFARFGGEEFILLVDHTDVDGAKKLAEKINLEIANMSTEFQNIKIQITVSIGIAALINSDRNIEDLIARSDEALYKAKNSGRNCHHFDMPDEGN